MNRLVLPTRLILKCHCTVGTDTGGWLQVFIDLQRVYVVDLSRNAPERDTAWLDLALFDEGRSWGRIDWCVV